MATWGALTIKFFYRGYRPPFTHGGLARIDLLPDYSNPSAVAQVIQQTNTERKTVKGTLVFDDYADYLSMEADKLAGTTKTLIAPEETGDTYAIEDLGEPDYRQNDAIFATVSFVEAS